MAAAKEKFDVYEMITKEVIARLEAGIIMWRNPVRPIGVHVSLKSKKAYRGINQLLLELRAMEGGFSSPYWLTFKQAQELSKDHTDPSENFESPSSPVWDTEPKWREDDDTGERIYYENGVQATDEDGNFLYHGGVRQGEKSTIVVFYKPIKIKDKATGDEKQIRLLRYYRVFNIEQIDGIDHRIPEVEAREHTPVEEAEELMENYLKDAVSLTLEKNAPRNTAAYRRKDDTILMPAAERFDCVEEYYAALFHEAVHSTGVDHRLKRDMGESFGTAKYSSEELVAEMGAAFLCALTGVQDKRSLDNSAAYIAGWKKALEDDGKLVVRASFAAQKAADFIQGIKWDNEKKED